MLPDSPSIAEFLIHELKKGEMVALNGETYSQSDTFILENQLSKKEIKLDTSVSLIYQIWKDKPAIPEASIFEMPLDFCGKSVEDKIIEINQILHNAGADCTILSALDEIAWTFNLRGTDVCFNTVAISYDFI